MCFRYAFHKTRNKIMFFNTSIKICFICCRTPKTELEITQIIVYTARLLSRSLWLSGYELQLLGIVEYIPAAAMPNYYNNL